MLSLLSVTVVALFALPTEDARFLEKCFEGYSTPAQKLSRAVDLLFSPRQMREDIQGEQEKAAAPILKDIQTRIIGSEVQPDGTMKPTRQFSWKDGHFLDDYSRQTSTESVEKILRQRQKILIEYIKSQGGLKATSPVPVAQRKSIRLLATACRNA